MNTKTKRLFFLAAYLTLFLYLSNVSYAATIGNAKWAKSNNIVSTTFGTTIIKAAAMSSSSSVSTRVIGTYKYSFPKPVSERSYGIDKVSITGLKTWDGNSGAPIVPFKPITLLIPSGYDVARVKVILGSKLDVSGRYLIPPAQEEVPLNNTGKIEPTPPDPLIYSLDDAYPSIPCGNVSIQKKHGYSILLLNLAPVEYYPQSERVSYYKNLTVQIEGVPTTIPAAINPKPDEINEIKSMVDNPDTTSSYLLGMPAAPTELAEQYQYIIITTNELANSAGYEYSFQNLIALKQARGLTAKLFTVDNDIRGKYDDTRPDGKHDIQTAIRNFIIDAYKNHGTRYVLLGGDRYHIQPRIFYASYSGYEANMPVDMYYACLDGTFDDNKNGTYGEKTDGVSGTDVDLYAEVAIGRACCATTAEVSNFVRKTLTYWKSSGDYLHTVYMLGEWLDYETYGSAYMEEMRTGSNANGYTTVGFENSPYKDFFDTPTLYDTPSGYTWRGSDLINIMNSGVHIANHLGHSNYTYNMRFYTPDSPFAGDPDSASINDLTNTDYFFAYSQGCLPGGFDNPGGTRCIAELITTMPYGAFAVIMNAREGWYNPGGTDSSSQQYQREFWDALCKEGITNIGKMNQDSKEDNISLINAKTYRWVYYELNLFGDPELSFHVSIAPPTPPAAPSNLSATAQGSTQINLTWTSNSSGIEDGFKIERKMGQAGTYTQVATVGMNVTTYSDTTGLTQNTTYYYRVRAYNIAGDSAYSNEANATTPIPPNAPSGLAATLISSTQINLAWTDNSNNENGFNIYRKADTAGTYAQVATVGANVTTYSDTGLMGGTTYYYKVTAYKNPANNSPYSNEAYATTPLAAPSNLSAMAISPTQISLNWTDNSNGETGFKIERKTGQTGTYAQITTVGANAIGYSDTGLTQNITYYYRVKTYNGTQETPYSNEAYALTPIPPNAPSNLSATSISTTQINLSWRDNSNNETGFKIERKTGQAAYAQVATVGANVTTYSDTGLTKGTAYYYRVKASNAAGDSPYSNEATATTPISPNAPSNLYATTISSTQINLNWADNSNNEDGFKVERKTGQTGTYAQITTVGANVKTYSDTGLTQDTRYYYRVRAYNNIGDSPYSNENSSTTQMVLNAPTNLFATAITSLRIDLTWTNNSPNAQYFNIERKTGATGTYNLIWATANVTSYSDSYNLTPSTTYYYRIRAYANNGNDNYSPYSNEAYATTPPAAPSNLYATTISSTQINLNWADNSNNEDGFKVERKTGQTGTYAQITTVGANVKTYSDIGLTQNTTYYYKVRSYNNVGDSPYSNENSSTTQMVLNAPTNLTATTISLTKINLSWTNNSPNAQVFAIERKTGATGTYSLLDWTNNATVTNYYDQHQLAPNTTYYYRIRAYADSNGVQNYSAYSNEAYATTTIVLNAPSNPSATAISSSQINLNWADNSNNEDGFKVERKTGTAGTYAQITILGANAIGYADTGLTQGATYYYRVRAYNSSGNSAYSNEANATTQMVLNAPTNLTATTMTLTKINLSWTNNSPNAQVFAIDRKTGATGTYSLLSWTNNATVTNYYDQYQLAPDTTYYYRIRAYADNNGVQNYSAYSNEAYATTSLTTYTITSSAGAGGYINPSGTGTVNSGANRTFNITPNTGYAIQSITIDGSAIANPASTYTFSNITANHTISAAFALAAPSNFTGTVNASNKVELTWKDNSNNETQFIVKRNGGGNPWYVVAGVSGMGSAVRFTDTNVSPNTRYWYAVCARNGSGDSQNSDTITVKTNPGR